MILARGSQWVAVLAKGDALVTLELQGDNLPGELAELRELRFDVPLSEWGRLVRNLRSDRKLLGGLLLDFARTKDRVATAVSSARLYLGLAGLVAEATISLVELGALEITPSEPLV